MKKLFFFTILVSMYFFQGCTEDDPFFDEEHPNNFDNYNRTLNITAYHVYDVIHEIDSVLPEVSVTIFHSREDFLEMENAEAMRITDSAGFCAFYGRAYDYYWIIASHDSLVTIIDSVHAEANTISHTTLFFY